MRGPGKADQASSSRTSPVKIVVISDTHGQHETLGELEGDVLIHCGDFCLDQRDAEADIASLDAWFARQRFRLIVCTGGNHDFEVEARRARGETVFRHAVCLQDEGVSLDGVKFHGAPWTPELSAWAHFKSERDLREAWSRIPDDTDVLISHTPPSGTLDQNSRGKRCGCPLLRERVDQVRPWLHCFGHIHASAGMVRGEATTSINAAVVNSQYRIARPPFIVDGAPPPRHARR